MPAANRLLLVTGDLFFSGKIGGTAAELGWTVRTIASDRAVPSTGELSETSIVLVDLELPGLNAADLAGQVKAAGVHLAGYAPHVKQHLFEQATAAGFDELLSRGALSANLLDRLRVWAK